MLAAVWSSSSSDVGIIIWSGDSGAGADAFLDLGAGAVSGAVADSGAGADAGADSCAVGVSGAGTDLGAGANFGAGADLIAGTSCMGSTPDLGTGANWASCGFGVVADLGPHGS